MTEHHTDITILGAGMVGLSTALLLANQTFKITIIDNNTPLLEWPSDSFDRRTVALNPSSVNVLRTINCWQQLHRSDIGVMQAMHVWDEAGGEHIDFDSNLTGQPALSYVVENRVLVRALWQLANEHPNITCITNSNPTGINRHHGNISLRLDNKQTWTSACLLGADGRNSWLRNELQIPFSTRPYQQTAVVAIIECNNDHNNTGYQAFLPTGPIGLLPLHHCQQMSMVWSTTEQHQQELTNMDEAAFNIALSNALGMKLGLCLRKTPLASFPLTEQHCQYYTTANAALLGDAAHAIHPLAGQGVNLGLADARCLTDILSKAKSQRKHIGSETVLRQYQRQRHAINQQMICLMQGFKSTFCDQAKWVVSLRNTGLSLANRSDVLKRYFINYAS